MNALNLWKRRLGRVAVYYVGYRDETGRRRWKSLGVSTKAEALRELTRFKEVLSQSRRKSSPSLIQFVADFKAYAATCYALKSQAMFNSVLATFSDNVGSILLSKVTPRHVDTWLALRMGEVKPVSANVELRTLRSALSTAVRWRLLETNPALAVALPRVPKEPAAFLTRPDLSLLLPHLPEHVRSIVRLAFHSGLRRGELLSLRWDQVDLNRGTIHVHSSANFRTKAGSDRVVPLNSEARAVLLSLERTSGPLFHRHGLPLEGGHVSKQFRKAVKAASLDSRLHFHSLRHSFCSNLVAQGVSLFQVGVLAGHKSPVVTQAYSHLQPSELGRVVELLAI